MRYRSPPAALIKSARLQTGLTQELAAGAVSSNEKTWQRWEYGKSAMPPGLFELFCLKTDLAWMLEELEINEDEGD